MKVVFLVNGLGLGNSTRCHAIIQHLAARGAEISVVTSGNGLWYFEGRPEVAHLQKLEAFYYASVNGRISIPRTLLSVGDFRRIAKRNSAAVEAVLDEFKPAVAITDSVYTRKPMRTRGIPILALNNADVVHLSYKRFADKPKSIRAQFYAIEEMDYRYHRSFPDLVLSPNLDPTLPEVGGRFRRIGPIVRQGYSPTERTGPVKRVLIMLSGSRFGSPVSLSGRDFPFAVDVVGREAPKDVTLPPNVRFHGRVRDNGAIVQEADLVLVNGGFSAVSEAFAMRKPMVVLPIPNHAEQWINARTIEHLGVGFMAGEDAIEEAMAKAIARVDDLRAAYRLLPPSGDGAAEAADVIMSMARGKQG